MMQLTPCVHAIHFSDYDERSAGHKPTPGDGAAKVSPTEGSQPPGDDDDLSPGLPEGTGELDPEGRAEEVVRTSGACVCM